jgi:hypothetical protein
MLQSLLSWRGITVAFTGAAFLFACAAEPAASTKKKRTPMEPGDEFYDDDIPSLEEGLAPTSNEDSGAFGAQERPAPSGSNKDAGGVLVDAGSDGGVVVPPPKVFCDGPLVAGDLHVTEMLISSRAGSNDDGEWVEIRSTRTCWLKLQGLAIESPRGAAVNGVTVADNFELPPKGSFVVADSADPAKNHGLPGKVYAWAVTDVLKNDGDTLALKVGATVVDTITYPAFSNITAGRALAFPSDCPATVRADWQRWSLTFDEYQVGFKGTPNGANDDVACY